jgi:arylsulfatase A-like enzyme
MAARLVVMTLVLLGGGEAGVATGVETTAAGAKGTERARPPNIVFLLADDLGWGDVSFNGRTSWTTPHLDRLLAQGRRFNRFYSGAAVCAPSRGVFLTGRYTIHNGVKENNDDLPASEVTLAEAVKPGGYATALFGKWHHGRPRAGEDTYVHPMDQGFDEFFGFTDATHAWEKFPSELWEGRSKVPVSGHADDLFADRAVEFIGRNAGRPFFLYLPFISAHFNIEAPDDEVALHRGKFPETDPAQPNNATYAAMVTRFDRNVGRVLAALDEAKLADNTLVVFTSDHGATFESGNLGTSNYHDSNAPLRGQKRTLWEGGLRVPACARWPGHIEAGSVSDLPMHAVDVWPTLLAAAEVAPPPEVRLDGIDLLPEWTGQGKSWPDRVLFWEWRSEGSDQLAALRGPWKLVITRGDKPELFDVVADSAERRDISAQYPARVQELKKALQGWLATEQSP